MRQLDLVLVSTGQLLVTDREPSKAELRGGPGLNYRWTYLPGNSLIGLRPKMALILSCWSSKVASQNCAASDARQRICYNPALNLISCW